MYASIPISASIYPIFSSWMANGACALSSFTAILCHLYPPPQVNELVAQQSSLAAGGIAELVLGESAYDRLRKSSPGCAEGLLYNS